MDFFDQRGPQRPARYPAPASYEDGPPPYDEYASYDEIGTESGSGSSYAGPRGRGLLAGAVTGLLGAAVAVGVANFTAAFVRPQASPVRVVGGRFVDRASSVLQHLAAGRFGGHDKNILLLGLFAAIALIAMAIGMLAWRRVWLGAAGIGLLGLAQAYVVMNRPGSRGTDAIPSIVGGLAAIAVTVWLVRAGTRPDAGETPGYETAAYETADYESAGYATGDYATGDYATGDYATADYESADYAPAGYESLGYESPAGYESPTYRAETYELPAYQTPAYGTAAYEPETSGMPAYRTGWPA